MMVDEHSHIVSLVVQATFCAQFVAQLPCCVVPIATSIQKTEGDRPSAY